MAWCLPRTLRMDVFNAEDFEYRLASGEFDDALSDTLAQLTREQVEQVVALVLKHANDPTEDFNRPQENG